MDLVLTDIKNRENVDYINQYKRKIIKKFTKGMSKANYQHPSLDKYDHLDSRYLILVQNQKTLAGLRINHCEARNFMES